MKLQVNEYQKNNKNIMKTVLKFFAIITLAIFVFSCEEDSPLVDNTPPVVNIPVVVDPNAPTIESLSTLSIHIGDLLLINATNLEAVNTVKIGSVIISPDYFLTRLIPTQLRIIVPKEAIAGGTVTLSNTKGIFTFNPGITIKNTNLPVITDFYPKNGKVGDVITIEGQNFDYRSDDIVPSITLYMLNQAITTLTFTPTKMTFIVTDSFYLGGKLSIDQKYNQYKYTQTTASFVYNEPAVAQQFYDSQWQNFSVTTQLQVPNPSPLAILQADKYQRWVFPYLIADPNCGFTNCGGRILMYTKNLSFPYNVFFVDDAISISFAGGQPLDAYVISSIRFFLVKNPGRYQNVNQSDTYEVACQKLGVAP